MARGKKELAFIGATVLSLLTMATFSGSWTSVDATATASNRAALDDVMRLASNDTAPKGAPLGASGAAPKGAPLSGAKVSPAGTAPRVLPQSALDEMKAINGDSKDPMAFESTADGRWIKLTFAAMGSFKYEVPDPVKIRMSRTPNKPLKEQIPQKLKNLDGVPCLVAGFMVPIEITRDGNVSSFAITQNQQFCCFGVPPALNEYVLVKMDEGTTAEYIMDQPVAAYGIMSVSEEFDNGYVTSIYRMKSSEVISAHELLKRAKKTSGTSGN